MKVDVSYVIPTLNEEEYLEETLESIQQQTTNLKTETIVVDGGSKDKTLETARQKNCKILENIKGRGNARHKGAQKAKGEYIAFIDADTKLKPGYTDSMTQSVEQNNLVAASSKFTMEGYRAKIIQIFGNTFFGRKRKPLLPGFNTFVKKDAYQQQGFEDIMGEDLQFSNKITKAGETAIKPEKLVTTSGRRVKKIGITGTLIYYGIKDFSRRISNLAGSKVWNPSKKPL